MRQGLNEEGVLDSNSAMFSFLLPSFFAAMFSAILTGVDLSYASATVSFGGSTNVTLIYGPNIGPGRSSHGQGGFMMIGWLISICFGAVAGALIGLFYKILD